MASDNGRRGSKLLKVGAVGAALTALTVASRKSGITFPKLPKLPALADLFKPTGQAELQARTASPFPSFFREKPQERSRRARFAALKAESAKVPLLGGEGILGSFLDLF